jgi:hypothetical protein
MCKLYEYCYVKLVWQGPIVFLKFHSFLLQKKGAILISFASNWITLFWGVIIYSKGQSDNYVNQYHSTNLHIPINFSSKVTLFVVVITCMLVISAVI